MPTKIDDRLLSFASEVDDLTLQQARETASMPFIHPHVALMPDAHFGKGSAVGTVIPTKGAVIPAAVGVDIGCGMVAARMCYSAKHLEGLDLAALRESVESAIPLSPGNYNRGTDRFEFTAARITELHDMSQATMVDLEHSPKWREQLGSLKVAQKLCARWFVDLPNPDLAFLPEGTPEFTEYIRELVWAQAFALQNRAEMMDRFRRAFAHWIGEDPDTAEELETERINTHHNYTRKERHAGVDVWLTRKGAIDAHEGVRGLIPGSMGTRSYVVTGKGNPAGLCSAPHGAGRRFSRNEAKKRFTEADLEARMAGIEYRHGKEWIDEIPDAYKPIDVVMADAADLVSIDAELRQLMNVKGV